MVYFSLTAVDGKQEIKLENRTLDAILSDYETATKTQANFQIFELPFELDRADRHKIKDAKILQLLTILEDFEFDINLLDSLLTATLQLGIKIGKGEAVPVTVEEIENAL